MIETLWGQDLDRLFGFRTHAPLPLMFWRLCCVCWKFICLLAKNKCKILANVTFNCVNWNKITIFKTYALIVISNKIAAIGMMNNPSQNTGDVNSSVCIPVNTAAIGIDGQKLLQVQEKRFCGKKLSCFHAMAQFYAKINLPINYDEYEPHKDWSPNGQVCEPSPVVGN